MPELLIITVNYKGADATANFLQSASELEGFGNARILVVENGSEDGSAEQLLPVARKFENIELLQSSTNRGYFGAANWAFQNYLSRAGPLDWVIVCNNDITFEDRRFLSRLFQRDPGRQAVIAPAIVARQTGADCNPFLQQRPSRFQLLRYRFWQSNYYLMWLKQWLSPYVRILRHRISRQRSDSKPPTSRLIYAPHGAFLIFSRSYFEAGGYIDDGFFLYAEEFSVAEICRALKLQVLHDPGLRVLHDAHRVTGRMCNRNSYAQGRDGFEYALQKYFLAPNPRGSQ